MAPEGHISIRILVIVWSIMVWYSIVYREFLRAYGPNFSIGLIIGDCIWMVYSWYIFGYLLFSREFRTV